MERHAPTAAPHAHEPPSFWQVHDVVAVLLTAVALSAIVFGIATRRGGVGDDADRVRLQTGANVFPGLSPTTRKYLSLATLVLQTTTLAFVTRYSRTAHGAMYAASTTVALCEGVKLVVSLAMLVLQQGGVRGARLAIEWAVADEPRECARVFVPAVLFTVQNNLHFVAASHLPSPVFQTLYQARIISSAVFSVLLLGRSLSNLQWFAVCLLAVGVAVTHAAQAHAPHDASTDGQQPVVGVFAACTAVLISGFAGVYFEKILKSTSSSLWLRNAQISLFGTFAALLGVWMHDGGTVRANGFFYGYTKAVWAVILLQSLGGLLVAVVLLYADNILQGFASAIALVISCAAATVLAAFPATPEFVSGLGLVICAVLLYAAGHVPVKQLPREAYERAQKLLQEQEEQMWLADESGDESGAEGSDGAAAHPQP